MTKLDGRSLFENGKNHLDIYLNFNCNLRCSHCFLGDTLEKRQNFDKNSALRLMQYARINGATEVSFLGGEPTLYDDLQHMIQNAFELGFEELKLITNGLKPAQSFLRNYSLINKPTVVFSYDGATKLTFENIRGKNTFEIFKKTIDLAIDLNFPRAAIISVSNSNLSEVPEILKIVNALNFQYVNIHHVNGIGFATQDSIVSAKDWLTLREVIRELSQTLRLKIKFEKKFAEHSKEEKTNCVIKEQKDGNIMVFPDGRIFRCALFFNSNVPHSLFWNGQEIVSTIGINEKSICNLIDDCEGCAGNTFIGNKIELSTENKTYKTICMYKKEIM